MTSPVPRPLRAAGFLREALQLRAVLLVRVTVPLAAALMLVGCTGGTGSANGSRAVESPGDGSRATGYGDGSGAADSPGTNSRGAEFPAAGSAPRNPEVVVAVGASDTVGVGADDPSRQAWPQVLHQRALPAATLVNVGVSGSTVQEALDRQLPRALAAQPDLATVWLAVNDIASFVPVQTYERRLRRLVHELRRGGETEVLVGNVPDLWELPVYRACFPDAGATEAGCASLSVPTEAEVRALVRRYNAAIERVVAAEGARLVDLSDQGDLRGLTAPDGFHPSTAGHREIAKAFERVLQT